MLVPSADVLQNQKGQRQAAPRRFRHILLLPYWRHSKIIPYKRDLAVSGTRPARNRLVLRDLRGSALPV